MAFESYALEFILKTAPRSHTEPQTYNYNS